MVAAGRVGDACWLLEQFGPTGEVRVVDEIEADALVFAGTLQVRGNVDVEGKLHVGGDLRVEARVQAQTEVGILRGVRRGVGDAHLVEADLFGALAAQRFVGDRRQAQVAQRESELDAAQRRLARSETLARDGASSQQELDDDRTRMRGAQAAVTAAKAQVDAARAATEAARTQVTGAEAQVAAAQREEPETTFSGSDPRTPARTAG